MKFALRPRKVDIRLPRKGNSNSRGAKSVHQSHLSHDQVDPDTLVVSINQPSICTINQLSICTTTPDYNRLVGEVGGVLRARCRYGSVLGYVRWQSINIKGPHSSHAGLLGGGMSFGPRSSELEFFLQKYTGIQTKWLPETCIGSKKTHVYLS